MNGVSSLLRASRLELEGKASQGGFPVPGRRGPFLADVPECQVEQLQQRVVAREAVVLGGRDGLSRSRYRGQ